MTDADDEDRTIAEIRAYQRGRLIRSTPVRRAMSTPKRYEFTDGDAADGAGIIIEAASLSATQDGWQLGFSGESWAKTYEEADEMRQEYVSAVVADSPELAQARERIAALEADLYRETRRERDAALARVRELEAALLRYLQPDV